MKKYFAVILIVLIAGLSQAQTTRFTTEKAPVSTVLLAYSTLSGKELVVESGVTNQLKTVTMRINATKALTKAEAAKVIEQELRKQADVVIEPIDQKRVSVKLIKK